MNICTHDIDTDVIDLDPKKDPLFIVDIEKLGITKRDSKKIFNQVVGKLKKKNPGLIFYFIVGESNTGTALSSVYLNIKKS